jgi:UDP-glucose 4-epimerase
MRVAVTGGAGYIGSVVTETLVADGHDVLVIDSLVKGHRDAVMPEAAFAQVQLADGEAVAACLADFECDAVIHMAAHSLVGESVSDPAKYYQNNVVAGLSLLDAMRKAGVMKIVFSSTAAVYGEPVKQPIEECDPTHPTNPYGSTKLAFEEALKWYSKAYGMRSISLRYFNAAGATARHGERHHPETHLIPIVLEVAARQRPFVTVFGSDYPTPDGSCVRDYVHVSDLARAHVLALHALDRTECEVYNLGCGGEGYSVREVIETASRIADRSIAIETANRRAGDPAVLVASSTRIREALGWVPAFQNLGDIIGSAWDWMNTHA